MEKQEKIVSCVKEAEDMENSANYLLECIKKAVEIAIEKDEDTATQWLKSQIKSV